MQDSGNYAQKPIPLTGGLDLVSPRMLVEPGRLVDVQNYECVDTDGYKRIDGFERYDGGPTPSAVGGYYFLLDDNTYPDLSLINCSVGSVIQMDFGGAIDDTTPYAWCTVTGATQVTVTGGLSVTDTYWKVTLDTDNPALMDSGIAAITLARPDVVCYDSGYTTFWSVDKIDGLARVAQLADLAASISSADLTRAEVDALPQDQFVYALQHYKDRLHVVANCRYLYLALDPSLYSSHPAVTAREFHVGNYLRVGGSGGFEGRIMDYKFMRGDFFGLGTADGNRAWIKVLVYPTVPDGTLTSATAVNIDRVEETYTSAQVTCWMYYSSIDASGPADIATWGGALHRGLVEDSARSSTTNSWTQIDMGYEIAFDGGDSVSEPRELTLATTQAELNEESVTAVGFPESHADSFFNVSAGFSGSAANWAGWAGGGTTDQEDLTGGAYSLETDEGSPNQTGVYAIRASDIWGDGTGIYMGQLGLSIPSEAIIRGVEVSITCWHKSASGSLGNPGFNQAYLVEPDAGLSSNRGGQATNFAVTSTDPAVPSEITFGSSTDTWGLTLTPEILNDPLFKLKFAPSVGNSNPSAVQYLFFAKVNVTVSYFIPTGKMFFYDGTDHVETKLVRVGLDSGSWANGDAKGTLHVYDIVPSNARNYVKVGDKLRLTSGGADIGTVRGVAGSFLPSHTQLVASDRRFEIIRANYFLNPEWETIYGAHGLGRAWSYDNSYFRKIYTEYDSSLDKPSHLCSYRNYLALGFGSGNLLLSAISGDKGPLPEEFRATKGAREFVFVDQLHGLHELADTSLGVFCKSSVNRLVFNTGAATPDALFYQAVISPNSGCIEYTVAGFGDSTLYCDQYGVRTVDQTDVYGDLVARPLSYPVSPWLRPRLSNKKYWVDSKASKKPLFAHTIKAKNQYRVWFDDGAVLCMNLNTKDSAPQFTFLKYGFDFGGQFLPLCPIAFTNDTDNTVTERLHLAHWNRKLPSTNVENGATKFKYVFELERGWSFDGQDFPAKLTVNLSLLDSPYNFDNVKKAELHGLDYNNTTLFCGWGTKYSEELSYTGLAMGDTFTPAGRNVAGTVGTDYTPFNKVIQAASRGRPLLMKLKNSSTATGGDSSSAIEPPHILQAVLLQYIPLRNEG